MRNITAVVILIFLAVLSGCEKKIPAIGSTAPDFVLKDLNGKPVSLSDYRGKVVVLEFWATWCPPCSSAVPDLIDLYVKYKNRGGVLLAVSVDEDVFALKSFVKAYGIIYPVLFDDKNIDDMYGIHNIPTTLIIDREGRLVKKHLGYTPHMYEILSEDIEALL